MTTLTTWQEHRNCEWTWPNMHGVTGCLDHDQVFTTPNPDEAWQILGLDEGGAVGVAR